MLRSPLTREEVYAQTLKYFKNDELAANVFVNKYCLKDSDGKYYESDPSDMHKRLANEFARVDVKYELGLEELPSASECWKHEQYKNTMQAQCEHYFELFDEYRYVSPQGSPMSALGNPFQVQSASNCFVIESPLDSYGGILKTDQELVQLAKRRGGIGFNIDPLRPALTKVDNAALTSTGIGPFMERFSNSTKEVAQGGRRGALIMLLNVHHPEIETFITIKKDKTKVTGANISVMVTDEFMEAVRDDREYEQRWPVNDPNPKIKRKVKARKIWNLMMEAAWDSAEPGVLFIDNYHKNYPASGYENFRVVATNPCGEIGMQPNDSCRLLAMNLFSYVRDPFTKNAWFDYELFARHARDTQRLADNLVDLECELVDKIIEKVKQDPEPDFIKQTELELWHKIKETALSGRRTGVGITGLGDCLAALGLRYGGPASLVAVDKIFECLALNVYRESVQLAKERGAFPALDFELEKDNPYLQRIWKLDPQLYQDYLKYGRRNICCLTIAPTGSLSTQTRTTSGVEPLYLVMYTRRTRPVGDDSIDYYDEAGNPWHETKIYHPKFQMWMDVTGKTDFEESPYYQATAMDVNWETSVEIQAACQKWIDHSISKTCNVPNHVDVNLVSTVYMKAWESGCKGFTIFRDGSRDGVLVQESRKEPTFSYKDAHPRNEFIPCEVHKSRVKGEQWIILVGLMNGKPYEIFGGMCDPSLMKKFDASPPKFLRKRKFKSVRNKYDLYSGDDLVLNDIVDELDNPDHAVMTRLVSLSLRHGARPSFLAEQLRKDTDSSFDSFAKVMARTLKKYIEDGTPVSSDRLEGCKCEAPKLVYQDGCVSCLSCGLSKCS
jgi:ribonucleoside-diphosphate reductase alpha chain